MEILPNLPTQKLMHWFEGRRSRRHNPPSGQRVIQWPFTGEVFGLEAGSYEMSIRAPTLLDEMEFSEQRLAFEVESVQNQERNFLTCDENLLREMAEASGGNFLREENFHELKDAPIN